MLEDEKGNRKREGNLVVMVYQGMAIALSFCNVMLQVGRLHM